MKKIFLVLYTVFIAHCAFCQIQNGDFEQWEERDGRLLPIKWSYSNLISQNPEKETIIKNGNSSLMLYTTIGGVMPSSMISYIANGVCRAESGKNCGNPINFKPKFLTGFYNLYSISHSEPRILTKDTAMIRIILKKYTPSKKSADTLLNQFIPLYDTPNQNILTQFKQELFYNQNFKDINPDTVVIIIASNQRFFSKKLSYQGLLKYNKLIIDDLDLQEEVNSIENLTNNFTALTLYPNPTTATLGIHTSLQLAKLVVYQSNGTKVLESKATETLDVSALPEGLYLLEAWDMEGRRVLKKFEKR